MTATAKSMYSSAMGAAFDRLDPAVQRFHRLAGEHELHGEVETLAPASWQGKLLARCLGAPRHATQGPICFRLKARPDIETWRREFPHHTMQSRLCLQGVQLVEVLGPSRLTFALHETNGALVMRLLHLRFAGIPCPQWLMPKVVAEETGDARHVDHLRFTVQASVPGFGLVTGYHGHLVLPR